MARTVNVPQRVTRASSSTKSVLRRAGRSCSCSRSMRNAAALRRLRPHHGLAHEALVGQSVLEVAVPAQQQRLLNRLLQIPVRGLDAAVLVAQAAIVARADHTIVIEQRRVAHGEVLFFGQVLERGRQAVAAVFLRGAAGLPQGVLQPLGQRLEALATRDHFHMLPAREAQHEVVQEVGKRRVRNRDAQLAHGGKVRQATLARRMVLREEHFFGRPFQRAPVANVTLQGAQHAVGEAIGMIVLQFAQQRDGHQLGRAPQQRHDFGVPNLGKRIGARAPIASWIL
jgi:hypothetical protein